MIDSWDEGQAYESYIGRWSRPVAREFLRWLGIGPGQSWLDVGCGTGVLSDAVLRFTDPGEVVGVDRSAEYVTFAKRRAVDERVRFQTGSAEDLPLKDDSFDATVSGLMLNFVPRPGVAVAEMMRVTRPGGAVAAYLWDYAAGMQMLRYFWDAARALFDSANVQDEAVRFPICQPDVLVQLFRGAGLCDVEVIAIDVPTRFENFEDFWLPFTGGQGPAASFLKSLPDADRLRLRERVRESLPIEAAGTIELFARAWAVRARKSGNS